MKKMLACASAIAVLLGSLSLPTSADSTAFDLESYIQQYEDLFVERTPEEALVAKANADALAAEEIEMNLTEKYYNTYLADNLNNWSVRVASTRSVQLNTMFTNRFGALQDLAREYVNSLEADGTYDFNTADEYNGMKDVWYSFYFLRYIAVYPNGEQRYMEDPWCYGGGCDALASNGVCTVNGGEGSFPAYVQEENPALYSLLDSMVNGSNHVYGAQGQALDLGHLAASMTVYLFDLDKSSVGELFFEYNDIVHDNFTCWAGDLCQLVNEAYVSQSYNSLYSAVYGMMGQSQYSFSTEDIYSDADAVNLRYILEAYGVNNGTGNVDMDTLLYAYYGNSETHIEDFTDTLWYQKIFYYTRMENAVYGKHILKYTLTSEESEEVTLAFIDYMEDTFDVSISMEGYTG